MGASPGRAELEKIEQAAENLLQSEGMELVDMEFRKERQRWVLRVFIDKPGGVTLDDCAEISRQLGDQIDVYDLIHTPYTLEVSSPGLDRPLKKDKDFIRHLGQKIQLTIKEPIEKQTFFEGFLVDYQPGGLLHLAEKNKTREIPVSLIAKARLVFEG